MDLDKMLPKENQEMDVNYTLDFTDGVSQYLKGNKRLEEESYSEYRIRLKNEKKILKMYFLIFYNVKHLIQENGI